MRNNKFSFTLAIITWICVIAQFYITEGSFMNTISYFTVLSNSLIAISLTYSTLLSKSQPGIFFSHLSVKTAIVLYIFIVFAVYNTILRGIWKPTGWQLFLDNMLHVLIPVLYILYWLFFVSKEKLNWKNGLYWLLFPLVYLIYSLIRGSIVDWYPYPFLNVAKLGYDKVLINVLVMLFVFLISGSIIIAINNKFEKNNHL